MDKITHFEIPADQLQRAETFYQTVFGWEITPAPVEGTPYLMANTVKVGEDYRPLETGAINGGLMERRETGTAPVLVIQIEEMESAMGRVRDAGGEIVMEPMKVGDFGLYSRFKDTEGNVLGLWQNLWSSCS